MIKGLKDAQITDGLPRVLAEQPWVRALSLAMLELHRKTMDYIDASQVYTAIDTVAEEVLDALAVNWKIDWYDTGYDIEQKRRIVKTALNIRRTMGTAGAARTQADAIYPGTKLEEWFEYGGTHGKFRLRVNITTVEERQKFAAMTIEEIERRLAAAKDQKAFHPYQAWDPHTAGLHGHAYPERQVPAKGVGGPAEKRATVPGTQA